MTSFFRSVIIELDRDPNLYPEGNIIEWQKQLNTPDFDMIEIKRKGDMNVKCKIILNLDSNPQKFKLSPALADLLDVKMETKPHIVMGIWNYCKNHKLQDVEDKRLIRCDNRLAQIFGYPQLHFSQLPELITPHLSRPDPVVIDYTIRVDKPLSQSSKCYDIDVELDSPVRQKMMNIVSSTQTQKEIMGLDDKIVQCVQSINNSKIKRDFLIQFSKEPVEFINKWIASQARDLEVILGESKVNLEEVRQSEFYKQPWMKEAVFHYLTTKVNIYIYIFKKKGYKKLISLFYRHNKECKSYLQLNVDKKVKKKKISIPKIEYMLVEHDLYLILDLINRFLHQF